MPYADFGEKVSFGGGNKFLKLKSKGDKLRFRLLGRPFIEGKHFFKTEDGWDIQACPRVNEKQECPHCTKYMTAIGKAKKANDAEILKKAHKEFDKYNCTISVYYPIIDRGAMEFRVFQTTMGVRGKIEAEAEMGVKVLNVDFDIMRTELPGSDYYKLSRVDSAETTPFTDVEVEAIEKNKNVDLSEIVNGTADDDSSVSFQANSEVREDAEPQV